MSERLRNLLNREGVAPGFVGALLLLQLGVLRAVASADAQDIFVAHRALHWDCWFRQRFGVPCPMCGMTRSILLALHNQLAAAWSLNPAGTLLVAGVVLSGVMLIFIALCQQTRGDLKIRRWHGRLRAGACVYAVTLVFVLLIHWFAELLTR